jgi:F-type H+-transporting ATPase subunit alpha
VTAYIPTNVISITDGQIYLETDLFYAGVRPAINVGISVSRVGGKAQVKAMRKVAGRLRLDLAQYRELAAFTQFGTELDETTKAYLNRGKRTVEVLKQVQYVPMPVEKQVMIIYVATHGYLDDLPLEAARKFEEEFYPFMEKEYPDVGHSIATSKDLDENTEKKLNEAITKFKEQFQAELKQAQPEAERPA